MNFFVMVCEGKYPVAPVDVSPRIPGWMMGREVTAPNECPLQYELNPKYPGKPKMMYDELSVPLMHQSVRSVLDSAGVMNIRYYPAVLKDPLSGVTFEDYFAFNIVGTVACVDEARSQVIHGKMDAHGDTDFHSLVIDESKTGDLLVFRLAENFSAIIVHKVVKSAMEAAGIPGFIFYDPQNWAG